MDWCWLAAQAATQSLRLTSITKRVAPSIEFFIGAEPKGYPLTGCSHDPHFTSSQSTKLIELGFALEQVDEVDNSHIVRPLAVRI